MHHLILVQRSSGWFELHFLGYTTSNLGTQVLLSAVSKLFLPLFTIEGALI